MQPMPKRKKPSGIKSTCMVCKIKFDFVSASFAPVCNTCRENHENIKKVTK